MTFALVYIHARAGLQIVSVSLGKTAISRIPVDLKIPVSVDAISHSFGHQGINEGDNVGNVLGGSGLKGGPSNSEPLHIVVIRLDVGRRDLVTTDPLLIRSLDDFVINIGEVLGKFHGKAGVFQIPPQHIKDQRAPGMSDMTIVVDGHSAHVHADLAWDHRLERFLTSGQCIIDAQHVASLLHRRAAPGPM